MSQEYSKENKKGPVFTEPLTICLLFSLYLRLFTYFVNADLLFAALFL